MTNSPIEEVYRLAEAYAHFTRLFNSPHTITGALPAPRRYFITQPSWPLAGSGTRQHTTMEAFLAKLALEINTLDHEEMSSNNGTTVRIYV